MSLERRLTNLEARMPDKAWEIPMYTHIYFKHLENHRREEAGKPPIPLTPEEEAYERETEKDPAWREYWQEIHRQIEEYGFE